MKFNDNLRSFRKEKDFSQEYLAERMNVSRQTISKWENGTAMPDLKKLTELAELFDTSMDELLGTSAPIPRAENFSAEEIERCAYSIAKEQIDAFDKKNKTRHTILSVSIILLTVAIIITNITLLSNVNTLRDEINNINSNNTHYIYTDDGDDKTYLVYYTEDKVIEVDKENPNNIKLELTYSPDSYAKGTTVSFTRTDEEKKTYDAKQNGNSFVAIVDCDLTKKQKISINVDDGTNISTETYTDNVTDLYAGTVEFNFDVADETLQGGNTIYYYNLSSSYFDWSWDKNDAKPKLTEKWIELIDENEKVISHTKFNFDNSNDDDSIEIPAVQTAKPIANARLRIALVDEFGTIFYYYGEYTDKYYKSEIIFPNGKEYKS